MGEPSSILHMRGMCKSFPGARALDGVDFEVRAGEIHCLVGENGAGKSTLMHVLSGVMPFDAGEMELQGEPYRPKSPADATRRGIGIVPQDSRLVPGLSIADNLTLGAEPTHRGWIDRRTQEAQTTSMLSSLGCSFSPARFVDTLDMAERTFVELARALSRTRTLLIMDEPTASLSEEDSSRVLRTLCDLRDRGRAIILITHRLAEVLTVADRVTVLCDGRSMGTYLRSDLDRERLVRLMVGRDLDSVPRSTSPGQGTSLLTAQSIKGTVLRGVDLDLRSKEVLGVAGLADSGLHELARLLFGATPLRGGALTLRGRPYHPSHPADAIRAGLAFLPEDRNRQGLVPELTIRENATLSALARWSQWGWVRRSTEKNRTRQVWTKVHGADRNLEDHVTVLSGGNRQKVLLARGLLTDAEILLFNDPTAGIDIGARQEIHRLIRTLAAQGKAILCASTDLPELMLVCDRIIVLSRGTVSGCVDARSTTQEDLMHLMTREISHA